jgi:AraC family transcriptional regulator
MTWQALRVHRRSAAGDMPRLELPPVDTFTIVANVRGACRIESRRPNGWHAATFGVGDVGMTAPGRAVTLRWQILGEPHETVHIDVPMSTFGQFGATDVSHLDVLSRPDPVIGAMATALVEASRAGCDEIYAQSAAQYLAAHLLAPRTVQTPERRVLSDRQLGTITDYMHANMSSRISLDDLARQVALSRFHFLRLFTATTGRSPIRFLTELRVDTARRYLKSGNEPVMQVGKRVGFPSASHFASTFSRLVGCSPSEYRQNTKH